METTLQVSSNPIPASKGAKPKGELARVCTSHSVNEMKNDHQEKERNRPARRHLEFTCGQNEQKEPPAFTSLYIVPAFFSLLHGKKGLSLATRLQLTQR